MMLTASAQTSNDLGSTSYNDVSFDSVFQKGTWELGLNSGILFSPFFDIATHRTINYTTTGIQAGYMLTDSRGSGWRRGNIELLGEAFGGGIVSGRGNYTAGFALALRYNFIPESWRVVPFAQIGLGAEFTDIDTRLLGQRFNFNLDAALGMRWFVASRVSLNLEYRYQHISDADQTKLNVGINAHGPVVGVSWYF